MVRVGARTIIESKVGNTGTKYFLNCTFAVDDPKLGPNAGALAVPCSKSKLLFGLVIW